MYCYWFCFFFCCCCYCCYCCLCFFFLFFPLIFLPFPLLRSIDSRNLCLHVREIKFSLSKLAEQCSKRNSIIIKCPGSNNRHQFFPGSFDSNYEFNKFRCLFVCSFVNGYLLGRDSCLIEFYAADAL